MCCSVLQCVAVCCSVLWFVAVRCSLGHASSCAEVYQDTLAVSQHTAAHCNTLQHTATLCSTLQHSATHCNTLQHTATHCNTLPILRCLAIFRHPDCLHCTVSRVGELAREQEWAWVTVEGWSRSSGKLIPERERKLQVQRFENSRRWLISAFLYWLELPSPHNQIHSRSWYVFSMLKLTKYPPPYGGGFTFYYTRHATKRFFPHVHRAWPLHGSKTVRMWLPMKIG